MEELVNKVKESGLIQMDLAQFKPRREIVELDIANQLHMGLILKEKDFRQWIKDEDWSRYAAKAVALFCSADAIVPTWAFMLVASQLTAAGALVCFGNKQVLMRELVLSELDQLKLSDYEDGRVIIKGCSDHPLPEFAMVELIKRLQPVVKSILYGEPCSTVPVFKAKSK